MNPGQDSQHAACQPLVLLTAPDCHLCDHGREVLDRLARELGFSWVEVSTQSSRGQALAAVAPPLRPVLLTPGGQALAAGRLSERRLRRDLARLIEDEEKEFAHG